MSTSNHTDTIRLAINAAGAEGHLVAGAWDALDALLAENEQLRAALTWILDLLESRRGDVPRSIRDTDDAILRQAVRSARAAVRG